MRDLPLSKVYQLLEPRTGGSFDHGDQRPRQRHGNVLAHDG